MSVRRPVSPVREKGDQGGGRIIRRLLPGLQSFLSKEEFVGHGGSNGIGPLRTRVRFILKRLGFERMNGRVPPFRR